MRRSEIQTAQRHNSGYHVWMVLTDHNRARPRILSRVSVLRSALWTVGILVGLGIWYVVASD